MRIKKVSSNKNLKDVCLDILNQLQEMNDLKEIINFNNNLIKFKNRLEDKNLYIAVVGAFSSGKSTFINALIGKDILKHATTETTAVITRIVNVEKDSPLCQTGKVIYKDGTVKELSDLNSLKEYTSTFSSIHDVVKQIEYVDLFIPLLNTKKNIVIIDTPGLNGIAKGHREQTIELIKEAHFCMYLLQRRGLSETDVEFLRYIKKYQNNFIIIQNFIDEFHELEGENVADKIEEQKRILKEKVFIEDNRKENTFKFCVCGVSAWQELISIDTNIKRYSDDSEQNITENDRKEYHRKSGFEEYRQKLNEIFNDETIEQIQYGSTAWAIYQWIKSIIVSINTKKENTNELYILSKEKNFYEKLEQLKSKIEKNVPKQQHHLDIFILKECRDMRNQEKKSLVQRLEKLRANIYFQVDKENTLEGIEFYGKEKLPTILDDEIIGLYKDLNDEYNIKLTNLYQIISMRIEEYSGIDDNKDICFEKVNVKLAQDNNDRYKLYWNKIKSFEEERNDSIEELNKEQNDYNKLRADLEFVKDDIKFLDQEKQDKEDWRRNQIIVIGSEPAVEYRTEEVERKRGGILGWLGFKKKEKYTVTDTSKRDEWRNKKSNIENNYIQAINDLNGRKAALERRLTRLKNKSNISKEKLREIQNDIDILSENIDMEKVRMEEERKHAKLELLQLNRNRIKNTVQEYLFDNIQDIIFNKIEESMSQIECNLKKQAQQLFKLAVKNRLNMINSVKNENQPWKNKIDNIELIEKQLNIFVNNLEVYIK